ncbi:MAG: alpha/beta fold hydrolase [Solirubrobacteraceae bacterium]
MPRPSSTTLVLLHGFTNTGASWDAVRAALPAGYRAPAPDIRGHGRAAQFAPVTLDAVLDDLAQCSDEPFVLAGYSMGGRLALHAALSPRLRDRVTRLVLIGASPGLADADERAKRRREDERLAAEIEPLTVSEFAQRWARTPVLADQPPEVAAAAHVDRLRNPSTAGLAAALRGLGTGRLPSLWERLQEIAIPVTLVVGERDRRFAAIAERMAAALRDASVVCVEGAGHAAHLEAPAALAAALAGG